MDLLRQTLGFFQFLELNIELRPNQISLYLAILKEWNSNYRKPLFFPVEQKKMMRISRIGNAGTYTKCLKALHKSGLIQYKPGSRLRKARIYLMEILLKDPSLKNALNTGPKLNSNNGITDTSLIAKLGSPLKGKDLKSKKSYNIDLNNNKEREESPPGGHSRLNKFEDSINDEAAETSAMKLSFELLLKKYSEGGNIWDEINQDHFQFLRIKMNENLIQKAKPERLKQLMASNDSSNKELLKAYVTNDPGNKLVNEDFKNIAIFAYKIAVINHLESLKK